MKWFKRAKEDSGKDLIYVSLVSALSEGGCPICRLLAHVEVDTLRSLLYEHVNDPHVREIFVKGWGLCRYHSWLLARLAIEDPSLGGALGPAILLEDLLTRFIEAFDRGSLVEPGSGCYVCKQLREFENMYVESIAKRFRTTDLLDRYGASRNSILCVKHFNAVVQRCDQQVREKLIALQREKLSRLRNLVRSLIDKHDYRCREPITREEAESWILAIESLVGSSSLLSGIYKTYLR